MKPLHIVLILTFIATLFVCFSISHAGDANLSWDAPTNLDGTPVADSAGYKVHYGTVSGDYTEVIDTESLDTTHTVTNLTEGTKYPTQYSAETARTWHCTC